VSPGSGKARCSDLLCELNRRALALKAHVNDAQRLSRQYLFGASIQCALILFCLGHTARVSVNLGAAQITKRVVRGAVQALGRRIKHKQFLLPLAVHTSYRIAIKCNAAIDAAVARRSTLLHVLLNHWLFDGIAAIFAIEGDHGSFVGEQTVFGLFGR
jgi:hypothetical protein